MEKMTERLSFIARDKKRLSSLSIEIPAPGESRNSLTSPVDKNAKKLNRRSTWFGKAFDSIGNNGEIDKVLFIKATHDIDVSKNVELLRQKHVYSIRCSVLLL